MQKGHGELARTMTSTRGTHPEMIADIVDWWSRTTKMMMLCPTTMGQPERNAPGTNG